MFCCSDVPSLVVQTGVVNTTMWQSTSIPTSMHCLPLQRRGLHPNVLAARIPGERWVMPSRLSFEIRSGECGWGDAAGLGCSVAASYV